MGAEGKKGKKVFVKANKGELAVFQKGRVAAKEDEALQDSFTSDLTTASHLPKSHAALA